MPKLAIQSRFENEESEVSSAQEDNLCDSTVSRILGKSDIDCLLELHGDNGCLCFKGIFQFKGKLIIYMLLGIYEKFN